MAEYAVEVTRVEHGVIVVEADNITEAEDAAYEVAQSDPLGWYAETVDIQIEDIAELTGD